MIVYQLAPDECPETVIDSRAQRLASAQPGASDCFALRFTHQAYYRMPEVAEQLLALVHLSLSLETACLCIELSLGPVEEALLFDLAEVAANPGAIYEFAAVQGWPWLDLSAPLSLEPVIIPKPWGQEIWYTGIELRGQASIRAEGGLVPLAWLLSLLPQRMAAGRPRALTLLKVLDPLADEVYGDLYFEMHETKQEVYIVTHLDRQAWPEGRGAIQLGFCPAKRSAYASDALFKAAYLVAVNDYKEIRRHIDDLIDGQRRQAGIELCTPVSAVQQQQWLAQLAQLPGATALFDTEQRLRVEMNSFVAQVPLRLGDVVKIPCYVPHALQHGVRTVEFQSQSYERQILSFAQKVLTQMDWDTQAALEQVCMDPPPPEDAVLLQDHNGIRIERIARFDSFEVQRVYMAGASLLELEAHNYTLLMVINGALAPAKKPQGLGYAPVEYAPGEALLLPAKGATHRLEALAQSLLLLALPCTHPL